MSEKATTWSAHFGTRRFHQQFLCDVYSCRQECVHPINRGRNRSSSAQPLQMWLAFPKCKLPATLWLTSSAHRTVCDLENLINCTHTKEFILFMGSILNYSYKRVFVCVLPQERAVHCFVDAHDKFWNLKFRGHWSGSWLSALKCGREASSQNFALKLHWAMMPTDKGARTVIWCQLPAWGSINYCASHWTDVQKCTLRSVMVTISWVANIVSSSAIVHLLVQT